MRGMLSFGPDTPEFELRSLNVLIGPNGSGKSNLIDAISLLQAVPNDLSEPIRLGGGVAEWIWKGPDGRIAEVNVVIEPEFINPPIRHSIRFYESGQRFRLIDEGVVNIEHDKEPAILVYESRHGVASLRAVGPQGAEIRKLEPEDLNPNQSIISQRRDPEAYPELARLADGYSSIKLFREWSGGRDAAPRRAQGTDRAVDFLEENAANLALVLNDFENLSLKGNLLEKLRNADESITNYSCKVFGGTIQLFVHYEGLKSPVSATRLSDGTIRYLCLLSILCHPSPPPLVCLEEPELGLHPDLLPGLADLLIEASHRMQLIVTTHSDILVDALTKVPEAVVVCEKENGSTRMKRLDRDELSTWLKDYGLGQIWRRGEIGGNRW
jgi:predicted ATPase